MLYHKNSVLRRFYMPLKVFYLMMRERCFSISIQDLVNGVDGAGNPLGRVYSRSEVRKMLFNFGETKLMTHLVEAYEIPLVGRLLGVGLRAFLSKRFGWFLYAWGVKKAESPEAGENP